MCIKFNFHLQIAAYDALMKYESEVKGRARYGVRAFADALLVIPKTLGKFLTCPKTLQIVSNSVIKVYNFLKFIMYL